MTTQEYIEAKSKEFDEINDCIMCYGKQNRQTKWLQTYTTELVAMVREEENAKWIKEFGKNFDKPTQEVIKNSFQQGVDMTKESYDNAIKSLTKHI